MPDQPENEEVYFTLHDLCKSPDATPDQVQEFIDLRVDVNAQAPRSASPLSYAHKFRGNPGALIAAMREDDKNNSGGTPLHYAATFSKNPEILSLLIKAGADVNAKDACGNTPLHGAASYNENPEILTILLNAGADVNAKNDGGTTPLDWATSPPRGKPKPKNAEVLRAAGGKLGKDLP